MTAVRDVARRQGELDRSSSAGGDISPAGRTKRWRGEAPDLPRCGSAQVAESSFLVNLALTIDGNLKADYCQGHTLVRDDVMGRARSSREHGRLALGIEKNPGLLGQGKRIRRLPRAIQSDSSARWPHRADGAHIQFRT